VRDAEQLVRKLADHGVQFVIIGGYAAVAHGVTLLTRDLDLCIPFSQENMNRLVECLRKLHPRHRQHPSRPALSENPKVLARFKNLYLETDLGELDLLGEVAGIGTFSETLAQSVEIELWGRTCRILSLDALIAAKKAVHRPKDEEAIRQLEAIRERLNSKKG
jgi:predicted nucleotidyltransferase